MTLLNGVTDAMRQYEKTTEDIMKNRPKKSKEYGIKLPETMNIIAVIAVAFFIITVAVELM